MGWRGDIAITPVPFAVIRRLPISLRQLHLIVQPLGGSRRKYGGTVTRHGVRKGDYIEATQKKRTYGGWVGGDTDWQVSVSDQNWKRLGQFNKNKVRLIRRSTGLIITAARAMLREASRDESCREDTPLAISHPQMSLVKTACVASLSALKVTKLPVSHEVL